MAWPTVAGSGALTIDGNFQVHSTHSILVNARANIASGEGIISLGNVITAPSSLGALEAGVIYVESGSLTRS